MSLLRGILCAVLALPLLTLPVRGQGLTAQISGSVQDSSGSAIVGATVELVNAGTGATRQTTTDETGAFLIPQLLAGTYNISVTASGFKKHEQTNLPLSSNERSALRAITLELGSLTESISVTAEATKLQTQSAERAGTLSSRQILDIPQKGGTSFRC
jgi:hypothetical protein